MRVHLNIGGNLADPLSNINRAISFLSEWPGLVEGERRVSRPIESEPWGFDSVNRFVNVGMSFESVMAPYEILAATQAVERRISATAHRNRDGSYADRLIDIDIIFIGGLVVGNGSSGGDWENSLCAGNCRLTVPHRLAHLREFVLAPMAEIDPLWRHPLIGLTASEMLGRLRGRRLG